MNRHKHRFEGTKLVWAYLAVVTTATFVLTVLQPGGPF